MNKFFSIRAGFTLLVVAGALIVIRPLVLPSESQRLNQRAGQALSREDWQHARQFAQQALSVDPGDQQAIAIAGIASSKLHDAERAVDYLEQLPDFGSAIDSPTVPFELGMQHLKLGRLMDAETSFQAALKIDPEFVKAHRQLSLLLSFEGRCAEAAPHLLAEVQSGSFRSDQLCLLGIPERIVRTDGSLKSACETNFPNDPLRELGRARILVSDHHVELAEPIVQRVIARYPNLPLAHSLLGRIYIAQKRDDALIEWHKSLPKELTDNAHIWFVRSLWARKTNQTRAVVRCLLEILKSRPNHVEANYQLSQTFQQLKEVQRAKDFSVRSLSLSKLAYVINDLRDDPNTLLMQQAAEALEKLGRDWEAIGWCQLANQWQPGDWVKPIYDRLRSRISGDSGRIFAKLHPLHDIRVEDYPLPDWDENRSRKSLMAGSQQTGIRFSNDAERTGLDFQYFNSMDSKVGLEHIFQTTGGGAAAIDFDLDLWPDLYFGNGRVLPESSAGLHDPQALHHNALYRNRRGTQFNRVDSLAMSPGDRFSQGVTSGDFDNDGFPDLYVGNVGRNRLYQNNGDGTFTEIASETKTEGNEWTMSAMIADVDGDGLSDIYAVNYLKVDEVFDRKCKSDGQPLTCAPTLFTAEQDRLYRNLGNGNFEDVTDQWGITQPNGKGLGIVGLSVAGRKQLQLFIANDTTENLYFETESDAKESRYRENAVLAGLAMSETGTMQACMGVAAGDANGDGTIDLFVTNFFADSNTMYLQTATGLFTDGTRACNLADASYDMVGFGTQFLDADLDGREDLIVTNGHVDQTFATGEPDRMPCQFFHNIGDGRFTELDRSTLGDLFQQKRFGRAVVRLDWNRDQKDDACIVNLSERVVLATNETQTRNASVTLIVKGTAVARDAIGATVTLTTSNRQYSRQLTGGDGYQASNERKLTFGLAEGEQAVSVNIQWRDGFEESGPISAGEWIAVQGVDVFGI